MTDTTHFEITSTERTLAVSLIETMEESAFGAGQSDDRDHFTDSEIPRLLPNGDLDTGTMNAAAIEYAVEELRDPVWELHNVEAETLAHKIETAGCKECQRVQANNGFGPSHDASPRCKSGGHDHCTCDTCF